MGCLAIGRAAVFLCCGIAYGGLVVGGPAPLTETAQKADIVVVATIRSISNNSQGDVIQLAVHDILRGSAGTMRLAVVLAQPAPMNADDLYVASGLLPRNWVGRSGVWFLQTSSPYYRVLPTALGAYSAADAFIPVTDAGIDAQAPAGTAAQRVLWYQMRWYLSLPAPNNWDDARVFASLDRADLPDSLAAANLLIDSGKADQVAVGIEAELRRNSDDAITALAKNIGLLGASAKLPRVIGGLSLFYHPKTDAALPALQNLWSQHVSVPGIDAGLATAMARIGTKNALPTMAALLDSQDPQAQLRAASFFSQFALFADSNGNLPGTHVTGPLASFAVNANTPRRGSTETPAEYAQFWKAWWADHREALGFSAP